MHSGARAAALGRAAVARPSAGPCVAAVRGSCAALAERRRHHAGRLDRHRACPCRDLERRQNLPPQPTLRRRMNKSSACGLLLLARPWLDNVLGNAALSEGFLFLARPLIASAKARWPAEVDGRKWNGEIFPAHVEELCACLAPQSCRRATFLEKRAEQQRIGHVEGCGSSNPHNPTVDCDAQGVRPWTASSTSSVSS